MVNLIHLISLNRICQLVHLSEVQVSRENSKQISFSFYLTWTHSNVYEIGAVEEFNMTQHLSDNYNRFLKQDNGQEENMY